MAISKRARYEVLVRDGHRCRYCGIGSADGARLTVDHVVPVALGGGDGPDNLAAACAECNAGKSSTQPNGPLVRDVSRAAAVWADAVRQAASARAAELAGREADEQRFLDEWTLLQNRARRRAASLGEHWRVTLQSWLAAGVSMQEVLAFLPRAMQMDDPWRYLCGCCRNVMQSLQARATALAQQALEDEAPFECECDFAVNLRGPWPGWTSTGHASERDCKVAAEARVVGYLDGVLAGDVDRTAAVVAGILDGWLWVRGGPEQVLGMTPQQVLALKASNPVRFERFHAADAWLSIGRRGRPVEPDEQREADDEDAVSLTP
jgi:hypothetical protein